MDPRTQYFNIFKDAVKADMRIHAGNRELLDDICLYKIQKPIERSFEGANQAEKNICLLWAAFMHRWDILESLVKLGANVHYYEPEWGLGALHLAAFAGCIKGCKILIGLDANVNAKYKAYSPLHCAAFGNNAECAEVLIQAGAMVNALTYFSENVLHCAARTNASDFLSCLIQHEINVKQMNNDGQLPIHVALNYHAMPCLEIMLRSRKFNAIINSVDKNGETVVQMAARERDVRALELLVQHSADLTSKNKDGKSALEIIVEKLPTFLITQLRTIADQKSMAVLTSMHNVVIKD